MTCEHGYTSSWDCPYCACPACGEPEANCSPGSHATESFPEYLKHLARDLRESGSKETATDIDQAATQIEKLEADKIDLWSALVLLLSWDDAEDFDDVPDARMTYEQVKEECRKVRDKYDPNPSTNPSHGEDGDIHNTGKLAT